MFKSQLSKIITGWLVITVVGLSSFAASKRSITARRTEEMLQRKRARLAALQSENN